MIFVLSLAMGLLFLGLTMGASRRAISLTLILLFVVVLAIQAFLPPNHGLHRMTGASLQSWLILLGVLAVIGAYALILRWLKSKARPVIATPTEPKQQGLFSEAELERYARHIVLREIGGPGQQRLKSARVLVVGAGGLGSPALLYLAGAGIGTIGIVDDDTVSLSNLQRQVLHSEDRIGEPKVHSARQSIAAINPHVDVVPFNTRLTEANAQEILKDFDLVLDGSDNFATRYLVNETCVALGLPLIAAAISQWEGQISVYHPKGGTPCYACVFPQAPAAGLAPTCAEAGVMGALPGVIGSMMAVEAIKFVTGAGQPLKGEMLIYDALYGESRKLHLVRDENCNTCSGVAAD